MAGVSRAAAVSAAAAREQQAPEGGKSAAGSSFGPGRPTRRSHPDLRAQSAGLARPEAPGGNSSLRAVIGTPDGGGLFAGSSSSEEQRPTPQRQTRPEPSGPKRRRPRSTEPLLGAFGHRGERTWPERLRSSESSGKSQASVRCGLRAEASAGPREPYPRRANPVFGPAEGVKGPSFFRAAGVWAPPSASMEQKPKGASSRARWQHRAKATDFAMEQSPEAEGSPETSRKAVLARLDGERKASATARGQRPR
jgi:hypothetical protein